MNYIVLDTETTNTFDDPIVYDCGWNVIDENGRTIKSRSYVNADVFIEEQELMQTAYFSDKIPQYVKDIENGNRKLVRFSTIKNMLHQDCKKYNVRAIVAHNASFDYRALQTTQRWSTSSKWRYFFPYGIEIFDSLKMARQTFAKDNQYREFCKENGYTLKNGYPRLTAEILYRYLSGNNDFVESHTGKEDTDIEKIIFVECLKMNPNINCGLWD